MKNNKITLEDVPMKHHNIIRLFSVLVFLSTLFGFALSQSASRDVVYLKNGSIIKGEIIEQVPNKSIKIETSEGSIIICDFSDIIKITKEQVATQSQIRSEMTSSAAVNTIWLGGRLGLNLTNFVSDQLKGNTVKTGLVIGGIVEFRLSEVFAVEPGIIYSQVGCNYSGHDITDAYNYIEIPILIKAKFGTTDLKSYIIVGPSIGFEVAATETGPSYTADLGNSISATNFSVQFGGGIEYSVNPRTKLFSDVRYAYGLTNLFPTVSGFTEHTVVLSLQVGAEFAIN